jgi:hypothetical protein
MKKLYRIETEYEQEHGVDWDWPLWWELTPFRIRSYLLQVQNTQNTWNTDTPLPSSPSQPDETEYTN